MSEMSSFIASILTSALERARAHRHQAGVSKEKKDLFYAYRAYGDAVAMGMMVITLRGTGLLGDLDVTDVRKIRSIVGVATSEKSEAFQNLMGEHGRSFGLGAVRRSSAQEQDDLYDFLSLMAGVPLDEVE